MIVCMSAFSNSRADVPLFQAGSSSVARLEDGYSFFVALMKRVLPVIAITIAVTVIIWPYVNPLEEGFSVGYVTLSRTESQQPGMVNARLTGIDTRRRPYSVTAHKILQISEDGEVITLRAPQADITMTDGSWVAISSDIGVYRRSTHILGLRDNVNLYHDSGFEFQTTSAHIDVEQGRASGQEPVLGYGPTAKIKAQGFYLPGDGRRVIFTGQSHLVIGSQRVDKG